MQTNGEYQPSIATPGIITIIVFQEPPTIMIKHGTFMYHSSNRRGLTLVTALLIIAFITVTLAAGFVLVNTEQRTVSDQQVQGAVLGVAQYGIDAYLRHPENPAFRPGRTVHLPPLNYDTAWVPVNAATGDTAIVIVRLLHTSTLSSVDTMYVLSSLGKRGMNGVKGTPPAQQAIAEIVTWSGTTPIPVKAAWLSLSGVSKNGVSGTISGADAASPSCSSVGNVAGVSVPKQVLNRSGTSPGYNGPSNPLSGNPPLDTTSLGASPQTGADSLAKKGVDWSNWSQGLHLPNVWRLSDHGGAFPSFSDTSSYPVVYANGNVTLPSGQGLLIVSGSLTINGSTQWNGIVLVGNSVTSNGNNNIQGAVLSGLNVMLGSAVPVTSLRNGNKTFQYNSCKVKRALGGTKALMPRRGTWMDNWKTY